MRPRAVAEAEIARDRGPGLEDAGVGPQIDLLILHGPPKALDEDVVAPGARAMHSDGDLGRLQRLDELGAGELRALVCVEDVRSSMVSERLLESLAAKVCRQRDRRLPGQDLAAEPIDDGSEVDEAPHQGNVGDVRGPDLVGPGHRQAPEQVRMDLVPWCRLPGVRAVVERLDANFFMGVETCCRPTLWPPACNSPFSIRLPTNGYSRCSSSIRRISFRSASDAGCGR